MDIESTSTGIIISDIKGDMGESETLKLIQQEDGDVIMSIYSPSDEKFVCLEFCTSNGGGRYPVIAKKLRELISELSKS
jgi:hypothetical protein